VRLFFCNEIFNESTVVDIIYQFMSKFQERGISLELAYLTKLHHILTLTAIFS